MSLQSSTMKDNIPVSKIVGVQFSMLSPDEIRKASVVEVTSKETYMNGKPVAGGMVGVSMGGLVSRVTCCTERFLCPFNLLLWPSSGENNGFGVFGQTKK